MSKNAVTNLALATGLLPPAGWQSLVLGKAGDVQIKLFKVDPGGLQQETHVAWSESLIMIKGEMQVEINGSIHTVRAGEYLNIPAGQSHSICPGGHGHFLLIDPEP
ncbi:cupin domain-containing protein [Sphingopyxis sp.]|uniref:cupin domain-containing protein n=1 Tax=Sphingopyxis sp. TaxID=1908224 RepID=UPI002D77EDC5|nr:cupin domain-containing protein [Sphingopyxis sp.]HET6524477.1 cupin domain-containing protein [Sphingopyxis sp.]